MNTVNKSEGNHSTSSRSMEVRNDIESIFPMFASPWNFTQESSTNTRSTGLPLFRFDWGSNMIPWRFRIFFGIHSYGLHSTRKLKWGDIGYDKLNRRSVWKKFGQTLHFLTLEFADVSLEKGYQLDHAVRSHRYVQVSGLFVAVIAGLVVGKSVQDHKRGLDCTLSESILSETLFYAMIAGLLRSMISLSFLTSKRFDKWMINNFQFFQSIWAIMAMTACLGLFYFNPIPSCVVAGQEASTYSALVILVAVFYRLRFIYLMCLILLSSIAVLIVRWFSVSAGMNGFMDPIIMCAATLGSLGTVYFVEVLMRKDFVQSLAVTTESQRSDRLLRNVLPKRIIDILKKRQDGSGAGASMNAVGPGATALFTRAGGGVHMTDQSMMVTGSAQVHGSSWIGSRFDSRIGPSLANTAIAEAFDSVTILFADVVGFTKISARVSPEQLVLLLNELFTVFDNIADQNGLEKVKTIGDAYMSAGGLPTPHPLHAHAAARMGLQMLESVQMFCDDRGDPLLLRIGMHSGSCVAGVIGRRKFIYDVWGDCVNTASRMESHGEPMRVHCSQQTAERIQLDFELESRGELDIKGKGKM
jgi:class 3 adenylate cyclase